MVVSYVWYWVILAMLGILTTTLSRLLSLLWLSGDGRKDKERSSRYGTKGERRERKKGLTCDGGIHTLCGQGDDRSQPRRARYTRERERDVRER